MMLLLPGLHNLVEEPTPCPSVMLSQPQKPKDKAKGRCPEAKVVRTTLLASAHSSGKGRSCWQEATEHHTLTREGYGEGFYKET